MTKVVDAEGEVVSHNAVPYGLSAGPEVPATCAWGARYIFKRHWTGDRSVVQPYRSGPRKGKMHRVIKLGTFELELDLPDDRQGWSASHKDIRHELANWFNTVGIDTLKKHLDDAAIEPSGNEIVEFEKDGYHVMASPRASHGYLYVGCYKVPNE